MIAQRAAAMTRSGRAPALLLAFTLLLVVSAGAEAASCEWALRFTNDIVEYGQRATTSEDYVAARRTASDARSIAIDAAREAKGCGCPDAIPSYETVATQARYAGNAANLTAAQQYGRKIKQAGEEALVVLRACPGN